MDLVSSSYSLYSRHQNDTSLASCRHFTSFIVCVVLDSVEATSMSIETQRDDSFYRTSRTCSPISP